MSTVKPLPVTPVRVRPAVAFITMEVPPSESSGRRHRCLFAFRQLFAKYPLQSMTNSVAPVLWLDTVMLPALLVGVRARLAMA